MMRTRLGLVVALLFSTVARVASGQESVRFQYHPDLQWKMGTTFDVNDPFDDKVANCITGKPEDGSTSGSSLNVRVARDEDELRNLLRIDARLDAQFGPQASASAHFN